MELIEIEVVRPQPLQRLGQLGGGPLLRSLGGLAREEDVLAIGLQGGPELDLGVPVGRRDVEVVDSLLDGFRDDAIRVLLLDAADDNPAEPDD